MVNEPPLIVGLGAQTSVGLSLPANVAVVRAGLNNFQLSDYLLSYKDGEPLTVSQLPSLPSGESQWQRMKRMALHAAREALAPWLESAAQGQAQDLAVVISVPPTRPGVPAASGKQLAQDILADLPVRLNKPRCGLMDTGHEGGVTALGYAANLIRSGVVEAILVGGVDCYLQIDTLHWLETHDRLKGDVQPHGFIPGEGAGFVLLCSPTAAARDKLPVFAEILATGRAIEPRPWFSGAPSIGQGLTQAFQTVFSNYPNENVAVTYCDLNGESWRADEWAYAYVRNGHRHASPLKLRHPAANWGDVGAATGTLLTALASFELFHYYGPPSVALVWAASDELPIRSACLLRRTLGVAT